MLAELHLSHFRNIEQLALTPSPSINLILGENGSGKTSLLEAIFMLGMGRSFRSRSLKHVVMKGHQRLLVFGRTDTRIPVGVQYDLSRGLEIRLNNLPLRRLSDLVSHLPLQFIPANCHQFFEQGPRYRRRMVDWGVFHVEHAFNHHWLSYRKILQQRNSALRQKKAVSEIQLWDAQLARHGECIGELRRSYLTELQPYFERYFHQLCPEMVGQGEFTLRYQSGWTRGESLLRVLQDNIERDRALGYTRSGSHAADWSLRLNDADPYEMLSRGQQKLFFLALSLGQIALLTDKGKLDGSILLIDDLSSELDQAHQHIAISALRSLPVQVFISSTNTLLGDTPQRRDDRVFHVKQGQISVAAAELSTAGQT